VRASVPRIVFFGLATPSHYSSTGYLVPRISSLGLQRLHIIRVRALLSLESLLRANSALVLFECGRSCPSNRSFRPSAPSYYLSAGVIVPRIAPSGQQRLGIIRVWALLSLESLFQASNAFTLFECGLRSLESSSSGQQRFRIIRVRALVPRIIFFGLATPSHYSSAGFGPSNRLLRASSASALFKCGLWSLELFFSGQQRLRIIRVRASVPRIILFGPAAPPRYSSAGFGPSNYFLRANNASTLFECEF
jgi:hypothetical protein